MTIRDLKQKWKIQGKAGESLETPPPHEEASSIPQTGQAR